MIKNVIFDLGNVIFLLKFDELIDNKFKDTLSEEEKEDLKILVFCSKEWKALDDGTISKEDAVNKMVERATVKLKEPVKIIMDSWLEALEINLKMIDFIKELKKNNYNTYILSNAPLEIPQFVEKKGLSKYFNGMVFSAVEVKSKPYDPIYETIINRYSLVPEDTLFIDDRIDNIEAAKRNNINGYVFDYKKYEKFRKDLKDMYNIF